MTRYFFYIRHDGATIRDEEGDEFSSIEDARNSAIEAIRELAASRIKNGLIISDQHMDVRDEAGDLMLSISFREVIKEQLEL